jgi:glutaminase
MNIEPSAIGEVLAATYRATVDLRGGQNADYIPYLAQVPSHLYGLAIVTVDGRIYETGDSRYEFALESISKIVTMALVMEELGVEALRAKVGAEPTGMPFNSVVALELHQDRPQSPLVNAGAMASVSLVPGANAEERWSRILAFQGRMAGREIFLSDEVNASEQTTNFHNRAIAWLLQSGGTIYSDPMQACDVYTRQCSTLVTAVDLAVIGATLANGGVNPRTEQRVIETHHVACILAEMMMEGLYEASGDWAFEVGLPGKSGVGGGILAVVPGVMAIAGFAPPLDPIGNSVRAQRGVALIARSFGLNIFAPGSDAPSRRATGPKQ